MSADQITEHAEVIVVGMGPGSEDVAERLATVGCDVVGIDGRLVGGECPYWGCVPSKMMIRAANLLAEARRVPGMAGASTVHPDWTPVAQRIRDDATDNWNDQVAVDRFEEKGGRFIRGWAHLDGPTRVRGGRPDHRSLPGHRPQPRGQGLGPADPGAGRHPVLDQPGCHRDRGGAGVPGHHRRRADRGRARTGVLPIRFLGDHPRARIEADEPRRAGSRRAAGADLRRRGHRCPHRGEHRLGRPRPGRVLGRLRPGRSGGGRATAGGDRPAARHPGPQSGVPGHRPRGPGHPGRRPPPGGRRGVGGGGCHRQGGLHPRVDVPGGHRGQRHSEDGGDPGRLPGAAPGDVHRSGDRFGGAERTGGPRSRA